MLRALWDACAPLTAREVHAALTPQEPGAATGPAPTTVFTVLDRLHAKGWVTKRRSGSGGWEFAAAVHEADRAASAMITALLGAGDRDAALLRFAGRLSPDDGDLLRRALEG